MCDSMSCVGLADCEAMALMGQSRVGLTARPRKRNCPQTCWMKFLPFLSSGGDFEASVVYCFLAPYIMGLGGNGECWGSVGRVCWKSLRALVT